MKIIELLVRASKDEKMPRKIKFNKAIWEYNEYSGDYIHQGCCLFKDLFEYKRVYDFINNKVEVIEEDKKIEKLYPIYGSRLIDLGDKDQIKNGKSITYLILILNKMSKKIDELTDEINKMKEGK